MRGRGPERARFAGSAVLRCATLAVAVWCTPAAMAVSVAAAPTPPGEAASALAIDWETDRDQAMAAARRDGKPLLIDFWATWCQPCRDMEARLWSRPDVMAASRKFICLRVDVDRDPVTARRYHSEALPTLILADPWGTELARREGFSGPGEYVDLLRAMPADFKEVAPWQERLAANPRDVEALRQAGLAYHRLTLFDTSNEFLAKVLATKDAKAKPDLLAEALTIVGWNNLKLRNLKRARKSFERCLKEVPSHPALDVTLYGLLAVDIAEGDRARAEPLLTRLESCCPDSALTARARKDLASPVTQAR